MRSAAILLVMAICMPILYTSTAIQPASEKFQEIEGGAGIMGNGSLAGVRISGSETGVIYGNKTEPGAPFIYIAGSRLLGVCEKRQGGRVEQRDYITQNEYLYLGIYRLIEYRDSNNNSRFEGTSAGYDYHLLGTDVPVGGLSMNLTWTERHALIDTGNNKMLFKCTLSCAGPKEDLRWNDYSGRMEKYAGKQIAEQISLSIKVNISLREDHEEVPDSGCSETYGQTHEVSGNTVGMDANISYSISGWKYRYPDSKLMVQTVLGVYHEETEAGAEDVVNISTSSPRYLEIDNRTEVQSPKPIYGRSERVYLQENRIAELRRNINATSDGENESCTVYLMGLGKDMPEPSGTAGFSTITASTYRQANLTISGMQFSTSYFSPLPFNRVDAAPPWLVYSSLLLTGGIALSTVFISYREHRRH